MSSAEGDPDSVDVPMAGWEIRAESHHQLLDACLRAEARGDAASALEILRRARFISTFDWQRIVKEAVGTGAPTWLLGRWVRSQALRWMLLEHDERLIRAARMILESTWWVELKEPQAGPPEGLFAEIARTDAACQQIALYELGGLADYIDVRLAEEVLARMPMLRQWTKQPLTGYRLTDVAGRFARLDDVANGMPVEVRDLGHLVGLESGTCFLGRLVPIAERPGLVFDDPPFEVDEAVLDFISQPRGVRQLPLWLDALRNAVDNGRLPVGVTERGRARFGTDL